MINAARGPMMDEKALVKALKSGWIRGAALDVYEREPKTASGLTHRPNVVLVPHLGSASLETREAMGRLAASSLVEYLVWSGPVEFRQFNSTEVCFRVEDATGKE